MSDPYKTQGSQIIGEYRLGRKLGGGGFGSVYQAEHIHEHSQVAIKILQVSLSTPEDLRDFIKEAGTMTLLRHKHIIPLLYFNLSSEGFPFLVMEYASEGTLRDRHPKGSQVQLARIVEYVDQIASALQYAHDRRIIHRDVKPENMLLRADGTVLLSDFGIAKIMEQSTLMSVQTQIGTPVYMAPEQHMGHPCFASDQYALAVVVYEWISGMRPFQGTSFGLAVQHMTVPPTSLLNFLPTFPPSIEQVIFKALAKDPEQRFATAQEFATAFRTAVQQANFSEIYRKNVTLDENPAEEDSSQQPVTSTSKHTESEINTPSDPQFPLTDPPIEPDPVINTPPVPLSPITDEPIKSDPVINTPSVPQLPTTDQPIKPGTEIRPASDQLNHPLSANQPDTPTPQPIATTGEPFRAVKASKQLSPLRRNLFILSSVLLIGAIVSALIINRVSVNSANQQTNNNQSHTPPATHPPLTAGVLNTNTVSGLVKKWTFQTQERVESTPVVVGGIVYVGSMDNNVYAIDAQSGHKKWTFQTGGSVSSAPAVVDGIVYIGSMDDNVYAIDAQSGHEKWTFQTGGSISSSPTGPPRPRGPPGGPPAARPSSPAVLAGVVYISMTDSNVYAIDAQSGNKKWAFQTQSAVSSSPAVVDGIVYVGSQDGNIYAIDAQSGDKKWAFPTEGTISSSGGGPPPPPIASSPAVVDGVVYVGATDNSVYAIDAQSGHKKWAFQTRFFVVSSPAVADGVVYIGSFDKNLYAIDAQSGHKKWAFQTGGVIHSSPAVVGGMVYVGSFDGKVYAFGLP